MFGVKNEASTSTKLRIVANSALKNVHSKLSLNDCMWGGPNALADLVDVLVHWRSMEVALMLDVEKAYQALFKCEEEWHLW